MRLAYFALLAGLLATPSSAADPIPGIGPAAPIEKVHTGFQFIEGPAIDGKGNLYFSDIPAATIYKLNAKGKLSKFTEDSHHSNGLMFNADGMLVACEKEGQVAIWDTKKKKRKVLVGEYQDKPFNGCNDLVIDRSGGMYFTDPHFGLPKVLPQGEMAVYYRSPEGKVTRLIDDLKSPNGVILSPDEQTLYVVPSRQSEMMSYPVLSPGKIGEGKVFCRLKQPEGMTGTGGDGLTVDTKGNLYITSRIGLQVYNPEGELLGVIEFPEQPANVTFGGEDRSTLYVTARTSLYTAPTEATGHLFATGE